MREKLIGEVKVSVHNVYGALRWNTELPLTLTSEVGLDITGIGKGGN